MGEKKKVDKRRRRTREGLKSCVFGMYKRSARRRSYAFELELEEFLELCQKPCAYCGQKPSMSAAAWLNSILSDEDFFFNGIDRFDNEKGYIKGNVLPCCPTCNFLKGKLTVRDLIDHILKMLPKLWKMELK